MTRPDQLARLLDADDDVDIEFDAHLVVQPSMVLTGRRCASEILQGDAEDMLENNRLCQDCRGSTAADEKVNFYTWFRSCDILSSDSCADACRMPLYLRGLKNS